jgi:segregation and condensation protein A
MQMLEPTEISSIDQPFIAVVKGEKVTTLPQDLYIPPDALEVFLEAFAGPLDLLLYLIKKQNLEILDIPIAEITRQYMQYVEMMQALKLELAAEYLVMAAMLAEIKSRMLLPRPNSETHEEEDPRAELVRRLQEYERFKNAAQDIDALPRVERDIFLAQLSMPEIARIKPQPRVDLKEILFAFREVLERARLNAHHHLQREVLSIRDRMTQVLTKIRSDQFTEFKDLFDSSEGRMGVVVTFIALLELIRQTVIELVQAEPFGPIHVKAVS